VDPLESEQLEAALGRVLASPSLRRSMRAAGLARASQLTWAAAARQMMTVIHQVVKW